MIFMKKQQQLNIKRQTWRWAFFLTVILAFAVFASPAHVHATYYDETSGHWYMTGTAEAVFEGNIAI